MKINSKTSFFVFGALSGLLASVFFTGSGILHRSLTTTDAHSNCDSKYETLKSKFTQISTIDIEEYLRLKSMKEKYEKADEIFGKILNIFLLDLGLRISQKQLNALEKSIIPTSNPTTSMPETSISGENIPPKGTITLPENPGTSSSTQEVASKGEVETFLNRSILSDARSEWKNGKGLQDSDVQIINGAFFGHIEFLDRKKKNWDVELDTEGHLEAKKFIGRTLIKVSSRDGDMNSTSRASEGSELGQFNTGLDGALLINSNGGDGLMQLYYFPRLQTFAGNFYKKQGMDDFQHLGTLTLIKR